MWFFSASSNENSLSLVLHHLHVEQGQTKHRPGADQDQTVGLVHFRSVPACICFTHSKNTV